jgi:hypothetical protein
MKIEILNSKAGFKKGSIVDLKEQDCLNLWLQGVGKPIITFSDYSIIKNIKIKNNQHLVYFNNNKTGTLEWPSGNDPDCYANIRGE